MRCPETEAEAAQGLGGPWLCLVWIGWAFNKYFGPMLFLPVAPNHGLSAFILLPITGLGSQRKVQQHVLSERQFLGHGGVTLNAFRNSVGIVCSETKNEYLDLPTGGKLFARLHDIPLTMKTIPNAGRCISLY